MNKKHLCMSVMSAGTVVRIVSPFRQRILLIYLVNQSPQIQKIDHHRGPVTAVQVSNASEVLVSSSHDATVCLWSLENFTLLNSIQLATPILNIQISSDSVSTLEMASICLDHISDSDHCECLAFPIEI